MTLNTTSIHNNFLYGPWILLLPSIIISSSLIQAQSEFQEGWGWSKSWIQSGKLQRWESILNLKWEPSQHVNLGCPWLFLALTFQHFYPLEAALANEDTREGLSWWSCQGCPCVFATSAISEFLGCVNVWGRSRWFCLCGWTVSLYLPPSPSVCLCRKTV